jgi:predicted nucleic acid-binding protein
VITYIDTSVLLKLLVDDEVGDDAARRLWLESDFVVCAEIGHAEARAALASARRGGRLDADGLSTAKAELNTLWAQLDVVPVTTELVLAAGELAEAEGLRGYDAVHLAAALAGQATVVATADGQLLAAAQRRQLDVSNPLEPRWNA